MDVELHGTARASFGKTVNDVIDSMQEELFREKDFRFWECLGTNVALPSVKFDSVFIFTHFIQHFYHSGLGLPKEEMPFYDPQFAKYSDMIWASMKLPKLQIPRQPASRQAITLPKRKLSNS